MGLPELVFFMFFFGKWFFVWSIALETSWFDKGCNTTIHKKTDLTVKSVNQPVMYSQLTNMLLIVRLGYLIIRHVASFGYQIWGVNFLDLGKGVDGNELERTLSNYLRHILGIGKNIAGDILRYEAACPPYHVHWSTLIFRLWNSLQANHNAMAHSIWKVTSHFS